MNYTPKIYFGNSLDFVSAHSFLRFMNSNQMRNMVYVRHYLNFEGVNWKKMIDNSVRDHMPTKYEYNFLFTDFEKQLLQICIDNEETVQYEVNQRNSKFQLRELMRLLLILMNDYELNIMNTITDHKD